MITQNITLSLQFKQNYKKMMIQQEQYDEVIVRDSIESKEETFTCQQFIEEIKKLSDTSIVYTCHFSDSELTQIYDTTLENFNMKAMSLQVIRQFINGLKEKNKENLQSEIDYYQKEIMNLLKQNIETISKKEFWKIIGNRPNKEKDDLLSQVFIQKSRSTNYISCSKILAIINQALNEVQNNVSPNLSFDQLLTKRISEKDVEVHGDVNDIISAFQAEQNTQLQKYFNLWHKKMDYVYEFVADEQVRYHIQTYLEDITHFQSELIKEINDVYLKIQQLRNTCLQFDEFNKHLTSQIELYQQALQERKNQIVQLNEQIKHLQKEHQIMRHENSNLNGVMGEGHTNLVELSKQCLLFEQELVDYKQRYTELYTQYQRLVQQKHEQQKLTKKDEQGKIFAQRTIKQQLDDTLHKFNKLLKERNSERKVFQEKEQNRINQIQFLEEKVNQLENQIKNKTEKLNAYITSSRISEFRSSILKNSRISIKLTENMGSGIFDIRPSKLLRSTIKSKIEAPLSDDILHKSASRPLSRQSIDLREKQEVKDEKTLTGSSSKSKLKGITIEADALPEIEEEDDVSHVVDVSILPPQQNIINIISKDSILEGISDSWINQSEKKEINQSVKESLLKSKLQDSKTEYFMSRGVLINIYGVKNETTFLMTKKRFCYFDTKLRLSKYLPIENIKCFIFCRTNSTLFIIRPKNLMELTKEHINHPLIISTRNRGAFASFLSNKLNKLIKDNQIQLITRYEDDIFLKIQGNEINMKHKIPNMKNPFRLCISHVPVFFVKLNEEGIFNRKHNAVIIVQPIGLMCFEGSQISQIEANREFLFLMPLEESCRIVEKEDSKQAPGRKVRVLYQTELLQSYYSMIFNTKQDVKLFVKVCQQQRKNNQNYRTQVYKSLQEMFKKGSIH